MAKVTELHGWSFGVGDCEIVAVDEHGQPVIENGRPKPEKAKQLIFIDPVTGEQIRVALPEDARAAIVRALTGGIDIATTVPVH